MTGKNFTFKVTGDKTSDWIVRRMKRIDTFQKVKNGDKKAMEELQLILEDFSTFPLDKTPLENLELIGFYYFGKNNFQETLPIIIMNQILGLFDVSRFASPTGKSEIVNNEVFVSKAFIMAGDLSMENSRKFIKNNPLIAKKLIDYGIDLAAENIKRVNYETFWPNSYGIEKSLRKSISEIGVIYLSEDDWSRSWDICIKYILKYYLNKFFYG